MNKVQDYLQPVTVQPKLLIDDARLQEIYELRVDVWEQTNPNGFVNRKLYPDGWKDELDEIALHWVITDEENRIIAAARLNVFHDLSHFPYCSSVNHLPLPSAFPFALLSRLVILPSYQGKGFCSILAACRLEFCKANHISWAQTYITNPKVKKIYYKQGFEVAGNAELSYHALSKPHTVDVFVKEF